MKSNGNRWSAAALLTFFSFARLSSGVLADDFDAKVRWAREKKGRVVVCYSDGKTAGAKALREVLENCPAGTVIRVLPGDYVFLDITESTADNLVFEGDESGGFCAMQLVIHGKNNVVRNLNAGRVEGRGLVVTDSKIGELLLWGAEKKGRETAYINNTIMRSLGVFANNATAEIRGCTIIAPAIARKVEVAAVAGYGGHDAYIYYSGQVCLGFGPMQDKGQVTLENCLLFSNSNLLGCPKNGKALKLKLKNNVLYARDNLMVADKTSVKSLDRLDDYFDLVGGVKGNSQRMPTFAVPLPENAANWFHWRNLRGAYFQPASDSEAIKRNIGARIGDKDMPAPSAVFGKMLSTNP